jgi:phosphoglycolate phosphatase
MTIEVNDERESHNLSTPRPIPPIELVCLDMAGTTVADGGLVESAFEAALNAAGVRDDSGRLLMLEYIRETMGQSKIAVFRALFGDDERAEIANLAFEAAYDDAVAAGRARPIEGAAEAITALRDSGRKVCLLTGFSVETKNRILKALGWEGIADLSLAPAEAGRGRPAPDLVLTAVLRLGIGDVAAVAVAGDTAADIATGRAAGASILAGVLTGFDSADRLWSEGATHVLASVADLPDVVEARTLPADRAGLSKSGDPRDESPH